MFPGKEHAELRPDEDLAGRYYDRVMLCIHDPGHALPRRLRVVSSQIDLSPTLLHILGINPRNHFEGHSIFGGRQRYPALLCMHEYYFGMVQPMAGAERRTSRPMAMRFASRNFTVAPPSRSAKASSISSPYRPRMS